VRVGGGPWAAGPGCGRFRGLGGGPTISIQRRDKALGRGRPRLGRPAGEPREICLSGPPSASDGFFDFMLCSKYGDRTV